MTACVPALLWLRRKLGRAHHLLTRDEAFEGTKAVLHLLDLRNLANPLDTLCLGEELLHEVGLGGDFESGNPVTNLARDRSGVVFGGCGCQVMVAIVTVVAETPKESLSHGWVGELDVDIA